MSETERHRETVRKREREIARDMIRLGDYTANGICARSPVCACVCVFGLAEFGVKLVDNDAAFASHV